jgi:hypothetical protein
MVTESFQLPKNECEGWIFLFFSKMITPTYTYFNNWKFQLPFDSGVC